MIVKKNAKKKCIVSVSCTLLAVITAGVAVMSTTQTALARATLPGVEKIIEGNSSSNPFVILEIVPEKEDAALGFLVAGEEPVDASAKSIKDMPDAEERRVRFEGATADTKITDLGIGDAVSFADYEEVETVDEDTVSVDIRGVFSEAQGGDYALRDATQQYDAITVVAEDTENPALNERKPSELIDMELYRRHMAFRPAEEDTEGIRYAVELTALGDTTDLPVKFVFKDDNTGNAEVDENSPVIEAYNHQYFVIKEEVEIITKEMTDEENGETGENEQVEAEVDLEAMSKYFGEMIFKVNRGDDGEITGLSYMGVLTNAQQAMLMFARPPVMEEETETVSGNEIDQETEGGMVSQNEIVQTPEVRTVSENEIVQTPEVRTVSENEPEEISDEPADDQARAFTTKTMVRMSVRLDDIVDGVEAGWEYVVVKEADGSDSDADVFYYISFLADSGFEQTADLVAYESYNHYSVPESREEREALVGEIFYVRKDNTLPYEYSVDGDGNGTGDYLFTADYSKELYDTVSYTGGFANKEWFKKYVFDLDDAQLEDMCIDVVTVTLEELNENRKLLDDADLIYFGDINDKGFPELPEQAEQTDNKQKITFTFDNTLTDTTGKYSIDLMHNNATLYNHDGKYLAMSGGGYVNVNLGDFLKNTDEITISFKMKVNSQSNPNWVYFIEPSPLYTAEKSGTTDQKYQFERYLGFLQQNGTMTAERYYNPSEADILTRPAHPSAYATAEEWTDVTVVYDTEETRLYIGKPGEVEPIYMSSSVDISDILSTSSTIQLGKGNWTPKGASVAGEYYNGMLDDFSIANYAVDEANTIYNSILVSAVKGVPVVLNRSLLDGDNASLSKMAALLMQENVVNPRVSVDEFDLEALKNSMIRPLSDGTQTFVNGNVFVYDDVMMAELVSGKFANGSFYNEEQITAGFAEVTAEIENENFYLEIAGKEDRISDEITMATAIRHIINHEDKRIVTKSSLRVLDLEPYDFEDYYPESAYAQEEYWREDYRHKTVYEDIYTPENQWNSAKTITTDSICITDGKLDKNKWIVENIAPQFEGNPNGLDVTIMGTKEFIGKLDDLNAEYDLIYLGMDTSIMNTELEAKEDGSNHKSDRTVYNDSSMNGLVYVHVGDMAPVANDSEYIHGDFRMSGNDITHDKLRELREYIEAGYAMIISDGFLETEDGKLTVNTHKIDSSSNMYKLINETVLATTDNGSYRYFGKNVNCKSNLEDGAVNVAGNREKFSRYLGISKLTLKYSDSDLPRAYNPSNDENVHEYLSPDSDGIYRLYYNVELQNDAAVGLATTSYNCKLYVDIDADGRYEDAEMLTGLSITDNSGNSYQQDSSGHYRLKAGKKYRIVREIPEGYTGFLAWKLVFEMNDRTYSGTDDNAVVRSHIIGYSAVPVSGIKPVINVLQITTHNPQLGTERVTTLDLDDAEMHVLYDAVQDFDINITQIPASRYVDKNHATYNGDESYSEYLNQYDMVVMGFKDVYEFGNGVGYDYLPNGDALTEQDVIDSMLAIREYALSGRSIMFTHDLNSPRIDDDISSEGKRWGWYANKILRDIQGMDRYGLLEASTLIPDEERYNYVSQYDEALLEGKAVDNTGLSNPLIQNLDHKVSIADLSATYYKYGENARRASWDYRTHLNYQQDKSLRDFTSTVSQVNSGQITEYPYNISDTFEATHSHPQYMQLNMDTDSRDDNDNDDIVVWYALDKISGWCDSYFAAHEMDVRNNFFIYNKGNVTYTGSGDGGYYDAGSQTMGEVTSIMEKKLFVNTLVASYRSGTHAARALFKESEWETSATITSTYLPYDPAMNDGSGGFLDQNLTLNFKTTNMDLRKSDDPIYVKFYVEGTATDHTLAVDGNYYKQITVESIDKLVAQDGSITKVPESSTVISNNSMHQVKIKHEYLGLMEGNAIRAKNSTTVYIRLGYEEMDEGSISLPATESITGVNIVCTQLFELK